MATLRFWGDKPLELLDILHYDTPVGWYVFEGFLTKALSRPFKIVDDNEKEVEITLEPAQVKDVMSKLIKAFAESNKSYSVCGMLQFGDGDEEFYYLTDKHITEFHLIPGTMQLDPSKTFEFTNPIASINDGDSEPIKVDGKVAAEKLIVIGNYDRDVGQFRCRYESIVDNMTSLSIMDQQLTLLIIRVGSGVRYIIAPAAMLSDAASRKEFKDFLQNLGLNSLLVVPQTADGDIFEFKLDFGEGTPPIDWAESRSNLLRGVALRIGAPERKMNGNEIGLKSGEDDTTEYLQNLDLEAKHWEPYILRALSLVLEDDITMHSIDWEDFIEPDEKEQVELFQLKIAAFQQALMIQNRAGMPLDWIMQKLNFDYTPDQSLIDQYEQERLALQDGLNTEETDDTQGSSDNEKTNGATNTQLQNQQS